MGIRIGIGSLKIGQGSTGVDWSSYWTTQDEVLFFGLYSEISGGQMPNKKAGASDFLTVAGAAGSETYQCPDTAPYIAADTDHIWFMEDETQRTVTTAELVGYDLQGTPVRYADSAPHTISAIIILSSAVTGDKRDQLFADMWLPVLWDNDLNGNGHVKDNRVGQTLWIPKIAEYEAVYNAFVTKPSNADAVIQNTMLKALVDGGVYAKAEFIDVFGVHNDDEGLFNWKDPTGDHNPALVNTPAFTAYAGFKGSSVTGSCVRLNFVLSTDATLISNSSIALLLGVGDNVAENIIDAGVYRDTNQHTLLQTRAANDRLYWASASATQAVLTYTNSIAHYCANRTGATDLAIYVNKAKTAVTAAASALPTDEMYACGGNVNGTPSANNKTIRYVILCSGLTDGEVEAAADAMEAYFDNYSKGLI